MSFMAETVEPDAELLMRVFHRLLDHFGPQHWWPGDTPLEIMVGAILTQNTAWSNVEKAIRSIKAHAEMSLGALIRLPEEVLAERIRSCGYFRVKARRLKNLLGAVRDHCDGDLATFLSLPTAELRAHLLAVSGVGPETADSIILYAARRSVFVVDAYTRRALLQHGWILPDASYEDIQSLFMDRIPRDVSLYNEYHALWVALGKNYCRPKPRCRGCPLEEYLTRR